MELQTNKDLPNGCVMTLKDVVDFINKERGVKNGDNGYINHSKAMKVIEKLSETPSFGEVEKFSTVYNSKGQTIKTYALTKKQAIASGAKIDNKMLMKVIDRVEELERNITKSRVIDNDNTTNKLLEGLLKQGNQTQELLSMTIQATLNNQSNSKLEEKKLQLEIDNLQIDKMEKIARLTKSMNLEEIGNVETIPSELRSSMKKATGATIKEVRPAINGISPTACLKQSGLNIKASELYKLLNQLGICEYYEYPHYTKGVVLKWKLTNSGRYYGYNQHSSSIKELPYQVKLYQDRFGELLDLLRNEGYID